MGLFDQFELLDWSQSRPYSNKVLELGIQQLIQILKVKGIELDDSEQYPLLWGDEMEYYLVDINHQKRQVTLSTSAYQLLSTLQTEEEEGQRHNLPFDSCWRPEFAKFMLEGTPGNPYNNLVEELCNVQGNMELRRRKVLDLIRHTDKKVISMAAFPSLGCKGSVDFNFEKVNKADSTCTGSGIISDDVINPNLRYLNMTRNLTERSKHSVKVQVPIFKDAFTPKQFKDGGDNGFIYFDCLSIGTSCCCLQTTFQAKDMEEARYLYDSLIPLAPIFLALSANSPIFKGYLSDVDCRWNLLVQACDERTKCEKDPNHSDYISKSRYDSSSRYISNHRHFKETYNDLKEQLHQPSFDTLIQNGIDAQLAKHFAFLFLRQPLTIPTSILEPQEFQTQEDGTLDNQLFENIQSSNWNSVRFKPPPTNSNIGFRVEFRTIEVQLTDFENAAYAIVMNLLVRTILHFNLNLFMPISKVDKNMQGAQQRDAVNSQKFWFRKVVGNETEHDGNVEMDLNTIVNGSTKEFVGLLPLVQNYLQETNTDSKTIHKLRPYLNFIKDRASGKLLTGAQFLRQFVHQHPRYNKDSKVDSSTTYDLIQLIDHISNDKLYDLAKDLVGEYPRQVKELATNSESTTDTDTNSELDDLVGFKLEDMALVSEEKKLFEGGVQGAVDRF